MRNNKGVTMIMLIITLIMLFILASISVYSSQRTSSEAKFTSAYESLSNVKEACDNALNLIEVSYANGGDDTGEMIDEFYFFGKTIRQEGIDEEELREKCGLVSGESFGERTYLIENTNNKDDIEGSEADKRRLERLGIKNLSVRIVADLDNEKYYVYGGAKRKDSTTVIYELKDFIKSYGTLVD